MSTHLLQKNIVGFKLRAYADLIRFNRPIGTLLLVWPMLIALWVSSHGNLSVKWLIVYLLGAFLMRSAGCAINDFADRGFDKHVERTKNRPLSTGVIRPIESILVAFVCALMAFGLVLCTNILTLQLSFVGVLLAFIYPFLKRYTHLPQLFLGATFAWAIPMVYSTVQNALPPELWWLYVATLLWAVAYDTEYAMVDKKDDIQIGVRSTAILFGTYTNIVIFMAHVLALVCLLVYACLSGVFGIRFMTCIAVSFLLICYQQFLIKNQDPDQCFKAFLNNQWIGAVWFLGVV